MVNTAKKIARL